MTQVPVIKFTEEIWRNAEHSMGMTPWQIANKAIEITIAEQATQVAKITTEYLDKALQAVVMHPDGKYSIADVFNKAQELIEQAEADKDIANTEAELNDYISADEARKLGTGAEWRGATGAWYQCSEGCAYIDTWNNAVIKYRAVRKEVPADPLASLPEELLTPEVKKALGEWIDSEQEPHAELRALYAQQKYNTANGLPGGLGDFDWQARAGTFMDWLTIEPDWSENLFYQCIPKALKDVSWLDMPVGVVVNCFQIEGVFTLQWVKDTACQITQEGQSFYPALSSLILAPSAQQPWIAVQDGQTNADVNSKLEAAGICVVWKVGDVFKVIGTAKGWELK